MPSLIELVGRIYGLDTVKQVQDWISTNGTTLGNKVEIRKIKATGSADRDFLVIYSGHG